ncbi:MAG: hypothetical protein LBT16_03570 [Treponema sp.]|jgi:hypothetical protein|nr:hypothetical protein [Treponema sp.]
MKTKHRILFGFAVFLMAAMFAFTGCDNGVGGDGAGGNVLAGTTWTAGGSLGWTFKYVDASKFESYMSADPSNDTMGGYGIYTVSGTEVTMKNSTNGTTSYTGVLNNASDPTSMAVSLAAAAGGQSLGTFTKQ